MSEEKINTWQIIYECLEDKEAKSIAEIRKCVNQRRKKMKMFHSRRLSNKHPTFRLKYQTVNSYLWILLQLGLVDREKLAREGRGDSVFHYYLTSDRTNEKWENPRKYYSPIR